jgi:transcriptional regulator with XRE-family HTH domain
MAKHFDGKAIRELFSKNLKLLRGKKQLSQLALSNKAGLAHNFVNDIENGKKWVSPDTIARLSEVLEIEPGAFFLSSPLDPPGTRKIRKYLDEINKRFSDAVGELKDNYVPSQDDDEEAD